MTLEKYREVLLERDLGASLLPPAREEELDALAARWGVELPAGFRALYRSFNGQDIEELPLNEPRWLTLAEIPAKQAEWRALVEECFGDSWPTLYTDEAVQPLPYCPGWLPFMEDEDGSLYCLDFAPTVAGRPGQVIFVGLDREPQNFDLLLEAPDFDHWLADLTAAYLQDDFHPFPSLADYFQRQQAAPLNPPATAAALATVEKRFGVRLPAALVYLYGLFDGYDGDFLGGRWLPLAQMAPVQRRWQEKLEARHGLGPRPDGDSRAQPCWFHPLWLPLYERPGALLCMDFAPAADGTLGQLLSLHADGDRLEWEDEQLETYLEGLLATDSEPLADPPA